MTDDSDTAWNKEQLEQHLAGITQLLRLGVFQCSAPFTSHSQMLWVELIVNMGELVKQALKAGKRIAFTDEVGTNGKQQDITSLLQSMRQSAYLFRAGMTNHPHLTIISPIFNHFYGAGKGYFANGLFFHCKHEGELAFFIGRERVYFHRHLIRAFLEAKQYLTSIQ